MRRGAEDHEQRSGAGCAARPRDRRRDGRADRGDDPSRDPREVGPGPRVRRHRGRRHRRHRVRGAVRPWRARGGRGAHLAGGGRDLAGGPEHAAHRVQPGGVQRDDRDREPPRRHAATRQRAAQRGDLERRCSDARRADRRLRGGGPGARPADGARRRPGQPLPRRHLLRPGDRRRRGRCHGRDQHRPRPRRDARGAARRLLVVPHGATVPSTSPPTSPAGTAGGAGRGASCSRPSRSGTTCGRTSRRRP